MAGPFGFRGASTPELLPAGRTSHVTLCARHGEILVRFFGSDSRGHGVRFITLWRAFVLPTARPPSATFGLTIRRPSSVLGRFISIYAAIHPLHATHATLPPYFYHAVALRRACPFNRTLRASGRQQRRNGRVRCRNITVTTITPPNQILRDYRTLSIFSYHKYRDTCTVFAPRVMLNSLAGGHERASLKGAHSVCDTHSRSHTFTAWIGPSSLLLRRVCLAAFSPHLHLTSARVSPLITHSASIRRHA